MRREARVDASAAAAAALLLGLVACGGEAEIEQPTPLFGEVPIEYPLHMWDQDMEGETLLRVRVSDIGMVDSVEVLQSSGYASFDSAAVAGADNLRFTPARRDGERIAVWAEVPVFFSKRPRPDTLGVRNPMDGA
ncbi:MAG TPA: energy transducer TonB [Longimicrobiales bacterium]|nr:energy transducer TonB [Longimicrobiales bacterium]